MLTKDEEEEKTFMMLKEYFENPVSYEKTKFENFYPRILVGVSKLCEFLLKKGQFTSLLSQTGLKFVGKDPYEVRYAVNQYFLNLYLKYHLEMDDLHNPGLYKEVSEFLGEKMSQASRGEFEGSAEE